MTFAKSCRIVHIICSFNPVKKEVRKGRNKIDL